MPASRQRPHPARVNRLALLILASAAGLPGCDALTGGDDDLFPVEGTWVMEDAPITAYLEVTASDLALYYGVEGQCFVVYRYDIVETAGDTYTIRDPDSGATLDLILRVVNGQLNVREADTSDAFQVYGPSDRAVSELQECGEGGAGGDASIVCDSLPSVSIGAPISGALTDSDESWVGAYYDLYGLTLGVAAQVQIDVVSDSIDSFLYLYAGDGTFIEGDDDSGAGLDASLQVSLEPGCHRIEVSSFGPGETGPYTLTVN